MLISIALYKNIILLLSSSYKAFSTMKKYCAFPLMEYIPTRDSGLFLLPLWTLWKFPHDTAYSGAFYQTQYMSFTTSNWASFFHLDNKCHRSEVQETYNLYFLQNFNLMNTWKWRRKDHGSKFQLLLAFVKHVSTNPGAKP